MRFVFAYLLSFQNSASPPFFIHSPHCDIHLCEFFNVWTFPVTSRRLCKASFRQYADCTFGSAYGFLMNGWRGFAFILIGNAFNFRLNSLRVVFTLSFLHFARHLRVWATFLQVRALWAPSKACSALTLPAHSCWKFVHVPVSLNGILRLASIVGHVWTSGNEAADAAARDATTRSSLVPVVFSWILRRFFVDASWANGSGTGTHTGQKAAKCVVFVVSLLFESREMSEGVKRTKSSLA
jgi:hypothetical protein